MKFDVTACSQQTGLMFQEISKTLIQYVFLSQKIQNEPSNQSLCFAQFYNAYKVLKVLIVILQENL